MAGPKHDIAEASLSTHINSLRLFQCDSRSILHREFPPIPFHHGVWVEQGARHVLVGDYCPRRDNLIDKYDPRVLHGLQGGR